MTGLLCVGETMGLGISDLVGPLAHATGLRLGIGGAESNVAVGVRRLGRAATWAGRLGADSVGDRVERDLRAEGLTLHVTRDGAAPTGFMIKERRTDVTSRVWYYRSGSAGSRLSPQDVPGDLVAAADAVHLTGITPGLSDTALATVRHVVAAARAAGVPFSFDVNHRVGVWGARDCGSVYRELAAQAAVVFAGPEEVALLTGSAERDPDRALTALSALTPGDAVLKLGAEGCLADLGGTRLRQPAIPVRVIDTVGAGDAFVAGYLTELLTGEAPQVRLATAVRCGAFACLAPGDWECLPTRAELALLDAVLDGGDPVRR